MLKENIRKYTEKLGISGLILLNLEEKIANLTVESRAEESRQRVRSIEHDITAILPNN